MKLKEYQIENSKYSVKKVRHYTTLYGLLGILRDGYIKPYTSRGDRDHSFIDKKDKKAVSFLDKNYDTEWVEINRQNNKKGNLINKTQHLALHQDKIAACIELDLDRYEDSKNIKLLKNFEVLANSFVNEWNLSVKNTQESALDAERIEELRKAYAQKGIEGYNSYLKGIEDLEFVEWAKESRNPDSWLWKDREDYDQRRNEEFKRINVDNLRNISEEEKEDFLKAAKDANLAKIYKIIRSLGVDKKIITGEIREPLWGATAAVRSAIIRLSQLLKKDPWAPIELRTTKKVELTKQNCVIYIFLGLVEGTNQTRLLPELKPFESEFNIKYVEPKESLKEKTFSTSIKHTYEEACEICKTPKRFLNYIRKHKDIYYKAGEFDKVESDLKYITGFIYGGEYCYSDYLDMIQEYFDEILPLGKEEDVEIYRGVRLDKEADFNWDSIGNCWTYDYDSALEFLKYFTDESKNPFLLTATTNRDNIDWILSICLNLTHVNEKELRLYDESLIEDPYIEHVEEDQIN